MNRRSFIKSLITLVVASQIPVDFVYENIDVRWYGIPYHQSNASTGTWLGISRA